MMNDLDLSGVYKITCVSNNKVYIGSASSFRKRFKSHKWELKKNVHKNKYLQNSWNKYGESSFLFEPIMICDKEDIRKFEQVCIKAFKSFGEGFNLHPIANGGSVPGSKRTDATREKMRNSQLGKKHSEESIKKMSLIKKGKKLGPCSEEKKLKISLAQKGKKRKPHSEETKEKMRKSHCIRKRNIRMNLLDKEE